MNAALLRYERADGAARVEFSSSPSGHTALSDLYQRAPCRVLFPRPEEGDAVQGVLVTTSGGLTGGDRACIGFAVRAGARATLTTQAAEKLYRAGPGESATRVQVDISVESDACAEWVPQETILFDGARLRRALQAEVAPTGRLLAVETIVFGRTAMGEQFNAGLLHDAWRVRRAGRLVWADALRLESDVRTTLRAPFGFGTAVACSTFVYVGPDSAALLETARDATRSSGLCCGATAFDGLLIVRALAADAMQLRLFVMELIGVLRHRASGLPARVPRVWHC